MDVNGRVAELVQQYNELKQRKEALGRITLPHLYKSDDYLTSNPDLAVEAKSIEKEILVKKDDNMEITIVSPYKEYSGDTELIYIVDNYRNETLSFIAEVSAIALELYLLSNFDETTNDSQRLIRSVIKDRVDELEKMISKDDITKSKEMYVAGMVTESIQALADAMEKNMSTENKTQETQEVKVNEALSMHMNTAINDVKSIKGEEVESKEESDEETSKESFMDKYGTAVKVGAGVVGVGLLGYAAYKLYENITSDDVVVIDSNVTNNDYDSMLEMI